MFTRNVKDNEDADDDRCVEKVKGMSAVFLPLSANQTRSR